MAAKTGKSTGGIKGIAPLAAIALMLVVGGCEGDRRPAGREYGKRSAQVAGGADLFGQHCSHCHGKSGSGGHMTAPLANHNFAFGGNKEAIMDTIRHGRPRGMPAFNGSLDDEQIASLASYILWLQ